LNYFENDTTTTTSATSVSIFGRGKPKQPFSDENDKLLYDYMNSTRKYRISGISGINKRKMLWNVLLKKH
jgi:hypothetical protein